MGKDMIVDLDPPDFRQLRAFRVVGLATTCTVADTSAIPRLWADFNRRCGEVPAPVAGAAYGVCCEVDVGGRFRYLAGFESPVGLPPAGFESVDLPASRYAVFKHVGHLADFGKTVYTIWNKALPDAGLEPRPAPNFELYDQRFDSTTLRGTVEIWIPVV